MIGESEGGTSVDLMSQSSVCVIFVRSVPSRLRAKRCTVEPWSQSPNAHSVVSFLDSYDEEQRPLVVGAGTRDPYSEPNVKWQRHSHQALQTMDQLQDCHSLEDDAVCRNTHISSYVCGFSIRPFGHCLKTCDESQVTPLPCRSFFDHVPLCPPCALSELCFYLLHDDQHLD
jgi:hypothetical protein